MRRLSRQDDVNVGAWRRPRRTGAVATYAGGMLWILLVIIAVAVAAYIFRVPLLAKLLGQSESRVRSRIERRKR